jgi:hypothetical protein
LTGRGEGKGGLLFGAGTSAMAPCVLRAGVEARRLTGNFDLPRAGRWVRACRPELLAGFRPGFLLDWVRTLWLARFLWGFVLFRDTSLADRRAFFITRPVFNPSPVVKCPFPRTIVLRSLSLGAFSSQNCSKGIARSTGFFGDI